MNLTDYEILYDLPAGEYDGKVLQGIRTVTWRAGRSLEVACFPIARRVPEAASREAKRRRTKEAMRLINARNLERDVMRMVEMNFTDRAMVFTGTYEYPGEDDIGLMNRDDLWALWTARRLQEGVKDVRRDVRNFLARVKRRMKDPKALYAPALLPEGQASAAPRNDPKDSRRQSRGDCRSAEPTGDVGNRRFTNAPPPGLVAPATRRSGATAIKWILRIEESAKETPLGLPPRFHIHMLIEAEGLNQDDIAEQWPFGFTRCDRFDLLHDGAARIARYLTKDKRSGRWVSHSRNLKKPVPRTSDRKLSRRRMARVAEDVQRNGRDILEKLYPGYRVAENIRITYSDYMPGCYIYARMRRRD